MSTEIQILIADDHPIVRQGLRQTIEAGGEAAEFRVIAEAGDGQAALTLLERLQPPIAVLDVDMPVLDGFGVARAVRERGWNIKLIFLTVHREETYLQQALSLGARGYVLKDSAVTDIVAALRAVQQGQTYLSPLMTSYLVNAPAPPAPVIANGLSQLTASERYVLRLIAEYKSTREIAEALYISPLTVETHRKNICRKLALRGSHALIKFALAHQTELRAE
ncbi:MAG: response regulator transcription factor [Acidobacteria bacterium]|nr:response regulator transcription factor [Acidobacteriota bacterium]MBI3424464.1 response regulator transcription factor [Acidobacteriota bacterium]